MKKNNEISVSELNQMIKTGQISIERGRIKNNKNELLPEYIKLLQKENVSQIALNDVKIVYCDLPKISLNKWYAGTHWTQRDKLKQQYKRIIKQESVKFPIIVTYKFYFKSRPLDADNCIAMIKLITDCAFTNDTNKMIAIGGIYSYKSTNKQDYVEIFIKENAIL
ncbi:MAG: hypothetical protein WCT77_06000 [Bacteroidota bacterium]|jgi:hypothetical protein